MLDVAETVQIEYRAGTDAAPTLIFGTALPAKFRDVLNTLNQQFDLINQDLAAQQQVFEDKIKLDGMEQSSLDAAWFEIEHKGNEVLRLVSVVKDQTLQRLKSLNGKHPVVAVVKDVTTKLANLIPTRMDYYSKACDYARSNYQAKRLLQEAEFTQQAAFEKQGTFKAHLYQNALASLAQAKQQLATSNAILPDLPHSNQILQAVVRLEGEVETALVAFCQETALQAARTGDESTLEEVLQLAARTLPQAALQEQTQQILARRAEGLAEINRRGELLAALAKDAAAKLRGAYEAWKAAQPVEKLDAAVVVQDIEAMNGRKIAIQFGWLGSGHFDEFVEIGGSQWYLAYEPSLRASLEAQTALLENSFRQIVENVRAKTGLSELNGTRVFLAEQAEVIAEITGTTVYTPKQKVRDNAGNVLYTIDGTPYPVPTVVMRGVAALYYVIFPGVSDSLTHSDIAAALA